MNINSILNRFGRIFNDIGEINRFTIAEKHEWEEKELRNMFALLVTGYLTGIPSPPVHLTTELLPYMEQDIHIMMERINTSYDPFGELFSTLDPI